MSPTDLPAWKRLAEHAKRLGDTPLRDLINDKERNDHLRMALGGVLFDFSKQHIDVPALQALFDLANEAQVMPRAQAMLQGEHVNESEDRAALHTALRGGSQASREIQAEVAAAKAQMDDIARRVESGAWLGTSGQPITDVVHIGIGGSHLGPELVVDALRDHKTSRLRIHFVANVDANDLMSTLAGLDPERTLFIVASKSFGTLETKLNALTARSWFLERTTAIDDIHKHFVGITTNTQAATEFGLDANNLLPLWDWVGGRYSLWSPIGLPIRLSLGAAGFENLLAGAREVDAHFSTSRPEANVPLLAALLATWNTNFLGAASLAVLSYDERLGVLPEYLQQLETESNGKSVTQTGAPVSQHTISFLWGGTGTRGQHAYHQMLHQGTRAYAADVIVIGHDDRGERVHHDQLLANALAQTQAMAVGYEADPDEPYRAVPGNHPTTTMVLDELAPHQLGAVLATYEHKVFCQGAIWGINSFDQWGVELGKNLALPIYDELAGAGSPVQDAHHDEATSHLIGYLRDLRD